MKGTLQRTIDNLPQIERCTQMRALVTHTLHLAALSPPEHQFFTHARDANRLFPYFG
jgi:hypothetical protein